MEQADMVKVQQGNFIFTHYLGPCCSPNPASALCAHSEKSRPVCLFVVPRQRLSQRYRKPPKQGASQLRTISPRLGTLSRPQHSFSETEPILSKTGHCAKIPVAQFCCRTIFVQNRTLCSGPPNMMTLRKISSKNSSLTPI